jgi:predicted anti-sigma-YlaC factor YlaD
VDGTLEETLCVEIERHMQNCENCRVVIDTLRKTISLYQSTASTSLPDEVRERLYHRLQLDEFIHL